MSNLNTYAPHEPVELDAIVRAETLTTLGRQNGHPDKVRDLASALLEGLQRTLAARQPVNGAEEVLSARRPLDVMVGKIRGVYAALESTQGEEDPEVPAGCIRATVTRHVQGGFIATPTQGGKGVFVLGQQSIQLKPGDQVIVRETTRLDGHGHNIAGLVEVVQ